HAEARAQREQADLRPQVAGRRAERGAPPRAEQYGAAPPPRRAGLFRERIPRGSHTRRSEGKAPQRELDTEAVPGGLERPLRLRDDLRPDPIAREDGNRVLLHRPSSSPKCGMWNAECGMVVGRSGP